MQLTQSILIWLSILFFIFLPSPARTWTPITVTRIIDGDTIAARIGGQGQEIRIRLYGIDAPEKKQAYGQQATRALKTLISGTVEMDVMDTDRYGRTVALIRAGGKDVNGKMVAAGMAWIYPKYCRAAFCDEWKSLESAARNARLGLWRDTNPIPPWEWRRR